MCGVAGILKPGLNKCDLRRLSLDNGFIACGPDHGDVFVDPSGFALSHRRLAIIDTSPAGQQPMISACGRFVIAFNGEIYNFRELRAQLDKEHVRFRSGSDTEVFLEYIAAYGVAEACHAANGMFAFAIWDRRNCKLTLGRDRFGRSNLWQRDGGFYFASELKAIRQVVTGSLERETNCRYFYDTGTYQRLGPSIETYAS